MPRDLQNFHLLSNDFGIADQAQFSISFHSFKKENKMKENKIYTKIDLRKKKKYVYIVFSF